MCSNIPAKPTYGVYVSQLIKISKICDNYVSFVKRHLLLTERLIKQGFGCSIDAIHYKIAICHSSSSYSSSFFSRPSAVVSYLLTLVYT